MRGISIFLIHPLLVRPFRTTCPYSGDSNRQKGKMPYTFPIWLWVDAHIGVMREFELRFMKVYIGYRGSCHRRKSASAPMCSCCFFDSMKPREMRTSGDASRNGENHRSSYLTEVGRKNRSKQTIAVAKQVHRQAKYRTSQCFQDIQTAPRGRERCSKIYTTAGVLSRGASTGLFLA